MKKRIKDIGVFIAIFMLHTVACSTNAQGFISSAQLESLFLQAVQVDGGDYIKLRENILSKPGVESFLKEKVNCTNLMERVLGRAMLSWGDDPATNAWYSNKIREHLNMLLSFHTAPNNIRYALYSTGNDVFGLKNDSRHQVLLPEMALKGSLFKDQKSPLVERYIKSFAAGLMGNMKDPDIPIILEKLYRASTFDFMRSCALIGMSKTDSTNRVEMLLDGLADESWIVREDANKKLMELTGQDLGGKTEAYRLVIETNGIFEVLPHLNAYIDVARRELESERIMFEKSSVRYTITRDEVVVTVSPPGYVTSATYIVPIDRETRKAKGHRWK